MSFFSSTDDATQSDEAVEAAAPGTPSRDARALGDDVRRGNVVVVLPGGDGAATLRADYGEASPALRRAGQAVIVETGAEGQPVRAYAHRRVIEVAGAEDAALQRFIEYWLGRGAP